MDPLSTAAASLQFAGVAVKALVAGIALLRSLRDGPEKLRSQLCDMEMAIPRMALIQQTVQDADSPLCKQLSPAKLQPLQAAAEKVNEAMVGLHSIIRPLVDAHQSPSTAPATKAWKRLVSIVKEREIAEKVEDVHRRHDHLMRELGLAALDVNLLVLGSSQHNALAIQESRLAAHVQLDHLGRSTALVHREVSVVSSGIANLSVSTASAASKLEGIESHVQGLASNVDSLREELNSTTHRLLDLQHLILSTTGERAPACPRPGRVPAVAAAAATTRLSEPENMVLAGELQRRFVLQPSLMRDACNFTVAQTARLSTWPCQCGTLRRETALRLGPLSLNVETKRKHDKTCPRAHVAGSAWRYRLAVQLLPLLSKTVELTFGATHGGGGFEMEQPLRVFATVRRDQSAVFQLFDDFPRRYGAVKKQAGYKGFAWVDSEDLRRVIWYPGQWFAGYDWDVEAVRQGLRNMAESLRDAVLQGTGSVRDRDQYGHTILHEIVMLISLLAPVYAAVEAEVDQLLCLAGEFGVDPNSVAEGGEQTRPLTYYRWSNLGSLQLGHRGSWTALQGARDWIALFGAESTSHSFVSRLFRSKHSDYDQSGPRDLKLESADDELGVHVWARSSFLRTLRQEPWLAEFVFPGALPGMILNRNRQGLELSLQDWNQHAAEVTYMGLNLLDLAIGWPEGLELLSTVWTGNISDTIDLAQQLWDHSSVRLLCQFPVPLLCNRRDALCFMRALLCSTLDISRLLVQALKDHHPPASNAGRHISQGTDHNDGLVGPNTSVYSLLVETYCGHAYVISFPMLSFILDDLWRAGYQDLDECRGITSVTGDCIEAGTGHTPPLERLLQEAPLICEDDDGWLYAAHWFLCKGASPVFSASSEHGNVLWGLARVLSAYSEDQYMQKFSSLPLGHIIRKAASLCPPLQRDECVCYCSSRGCLPLHPLIRGHWKFLSPPWCAGHAGYRALSWTASCDLDGPGGDLCIEEAVRLELFGRLGMTHTCCGGRPRLGDSDAAAEVREDDAELAEQLDLLMEAYHYFSPTVDELEGRSCAARLHCNCWGREEDDRWEEFRRGGLVARWVMWWAEVDKILPPYTAPARVPPADDEARARLEREALEEAGYAGLDFSEVIRRHFRAELGRSALVVEIDQALAQFALVVEQTDAETPGVQSANVDCTEDNADQAHEESAAETPRAESANMDSADDKTDPAQVGRSLGDGLWGQWMRGAVSFVREGDQIVEGREGDSEETEAGSPHETRLRCRDCGISFPFGTS